MSLTTASVGVRRVLICEDSRTYAAGLSQLLSRDPEIEVVGICSSAEETIGRLVEMDPKPHLVTMDLELPGMSGGDAIEQIMSAAPVPILVLSGHQAEDTVAASLGAGALEVLSKDALDLRDLDGSDALAFRRRVKVLSKVRVVRHPRARLGGKARMPAGNTGRPASVVGICASAGGPPALARLLTELPASYPIPILVVQHMADGFVDRFVQWLDDQIALPARIAEPGTAQPGVSVAAGGAHLMYMGSGWLRLDPGDDGSPHKPSGDVLLRSIAEGAGSAGVAVVLTGMGRDGAEGFDAVQRAGGLTIAQDEASSVVFGMPKAAADHGADAVLDPTAIGRRLAGLSPVARP